MENTKLLSQILKHTNNLNVYRYLQFILMAMPGLGKNPEPEMMAYVMPWAEKVIEQCRNK